MSTLKADTIQNTSGGAATLTKQHASKGLVKIDYSTTTADFSFNTSSLTDNGTGDFSNNLTNNMSDAEYPVTSSYYTDNATADFTTTVTIGGNVNGGTRTYTSSAHSIVLYSSAGVDHQVNIAIHGDLA